MSEGSTRMAEGMLSLSWNNHSAAFSHMLGTLREREIYTDVTLACGGKFYPVHKLVLSTCSDYFLQMFERTTCKHPIIILKDVQCREMEALLSYMYAGIVCVPQSDLAQLISVAESLQVKGLAVPDETMCTNKRMSYTWSPTDDRISPHAKRLRPEDNSSGVQYQRFSDGHTIIKPQTLTGIPSFAAGVPISRGYSPTAASVVKHVQPSVRPTYTTTLTSQRYSPYSKDTDRQNSPKMMHKMDVKETLGKFKTELYQDSGNSCKHTGAKVGTSSSFQSNGPEASTSQLSQNLSMEMEIIPEAAVKVELEEGSEPINMDGSGMIQVQSSDQDSMRKSLSKIDLREVTKPNVNMRFEGELTDEAAIKKEIDPSEEKKTSNKKYDCLVSMTSMSSSAGNNKETQTVKDEQTPVPPCRQEGAVEIPSAKTATSETGTNWEGDEDSSHPLDLSDSQKHQTLQRPENASIQSSSSEIQPNTEGTPKKYDNSIITKFPCPYCSFRTYQKSDLLKHVLTHTAEYPFRCPYCPFRAPLSVSLKEHMATHQGGSEPGQ